MRTWPPRRPGRATAPYFEWHGKVPADHRQHYVKPEAVHYYANQAGAINDPARLPTTVPGFAQLLREAFVQAGLGEVPAPGPPAQPGRTRKESTDRRQQFLSSREEFRDE